MQKEKPGYMNRASLSPAMGLGRVIERTTATNRMCTNRKIIRLLQVSKENRKIIMSRRRIAMLDSVG